MYSDLVEYFYDDEKNVLVHLGKHNIVLETKSWLGFYKLELKLASNSGSFL